MSLSISFRSKRRLNAYRRLLASLGDFVRRHPIISVGTGGCITGALGDCLAQRAEDRQFDVRRCLGVTTFSIFDSVFLYLPFYRFLDRRFGAVPTIQSVAAKVALDDGLFVPAVEVPLFFLWTSCAEGDAPIERLRCDYADTIKAGWMFNIPINIINFTLVPPPFRVIFCDAAEFGWSTLLSYLAHRTKQVVPGSS